MASTGDVLTYDDTAAGTPEDPKAVWAAPAAGGGTYPGTGALSIAQAAAPATLDLTAEGTLDWCAMAGVSVPPRLIDVHHSKVVGELLTDSFDWIRKGSNNTGVNTLTAPTLTAAASDDISSIALAGYNKNAYINDNTGYTTTGYGFRLRAAANQTPRILRLYAGVLQGATITVTAHLSDGSAADASDVLVSTGSLEERKWTIAYNAGRDGQFLTVRVVVTARDGTSLWGSVVFTAATLSLAP